ncbi:MAG: helix-turn-helix domain-containing protein, partial [Cryobacterium sp.]
MTDERYSPDMVKRLRISNACRLLDRSELTISAVSEAVGYRNLSNFNRHFFAETGVTPRAYRLIPSPIAR